MLDLREEKNIIFFHPFTSSLPLRLPKFQHLLKKQNIFLLLTAGLLYQNLVFYATRVWS